MTRVASIVLDELAEAVRALLKTPVGDLSHTESVIRCRVLLETYDEDRKETQ